MISDRLDGSPRLTCVDLIIICAAEMRVSPRIFYHPYPSFNVCDVRWCKQRRSTSNPGCDNGTSHAVSFDAR